MATLSMTTPAAHPARPVLLLAWGAMLLIQLPIILWGLATGTPPPLSWNLGVSAGLLVVVGFSLAWPALRPLRGYLLTLLALAAGLGLAGLVLEQPAVGAWLQTAPPALAHLGRTLPMRLLPTLLVVLTLVGSGLTRRDLFLVRGDPSAPVRPNRLFRDPVPWHRLAREFALYFGLGIVIFVVVNNRPDPGRLPQALLALPLLVLAAAINAAGEEFWFRSALLGRLAPVLGSSHALWLTAVMFGLGHFYGSPSGPIGVLLAGFLGWFLGKSVLETRGLTIAVATHGVVNTIQYVLLTAAATSPQ